MGLNGILCLPYILRGHCFNEYLCLFYAQERKKTGLFLCEKIKIIGVCKLHECSFCVPLPVMHKMNVVRVEPVIPYVFRIVAVSAAGIRDVGIRSLTGGIKGWRIINIRFLSWTTMQSL